MVVRVGHHELIDVLLGLLRPAGASPSGFRLRLDEVDQRIDVVGALIDVVPVELRRVGSRPRVAATSANK
jgi:hypothetical protein